MLLYPYNTYIKLDVFELDYTNISITDLLKIRGKQIYFLKVADLPEIFILIFVYDK